jgi:mycothiol synthase
MGATAEDVEVTRVGQPTAVEIREVLALARTASDADGTEPLSEHVLLRLRPGTEPSPAHLMVRDPAGLLAGYAQLEDDAETGGTAAELVVHPMRRRCGLGRALIGAVTRSAAAPLHVWAHGDHPAAAALALDLGFERVRELWQLRRSLAGPLDEPRLPAGVALRAFRPGEDDEAWLAVNRRAFADHPEQGRWTHDDLLVRMSEPWFDPAGFLLAVEESSGRLLGFHWTKVHPADPGQFGGEPVGEVYVVGVDPAAQGGGLGKALTLAGLHYLRERGVREIILYVESDNAPAVAVYTRLGFTLAYTNVAYQR